MKTKLLMTSSAVVLGIFGIALTFLPNEILGLIQEEASSSLQLLMQIIGALYFAFAMLNWMSKGSIIGGVYNRPICMANFTHFLIAGLALIKAVVATRDLYYGFWAIAFVYLLYAVLYGIILFGHPLKEEGFNNEGNNVIS